MTKSFKLLQRLIVIPRDFTWKELITVLDHFGFRQHEHSHGSRRKFVDDQKNIISLHQPHPGNIVKQYAIKQVIARLKELGYLSDE